MEQALLHTLQYHPTKLYMLLRIYKAKINIQLLPPRGRSPTDTQSSAHSPGLGSELLLLEAACHKPASIGDLLGLSMPVARARIPLETRCLELLYLGAVEEQRSEMQS